MLLGAVVWMKGGTPIFTLLGLVGVLVVMFCWWSDVIKEAHNGVDHTPVVLIGLKYGFILFIISEVMFFVAWFWGFFDPALFTPPATEEFTAGGQFPPEGIHPLSPWKLPLINTLILLLSGCTLTAAHHYLLEMRENDALTCVLGAVFLVCQAIEYMEAYHEGLTLQSTYYGGAFFMATGFHGMHVLIGTIFLIVCLVRVGRGHFTAERHVGFEAAAWYWHFVDVVWLFLFVVIYVGSVSFFAVGGH
ncbi:UNVERIFIED_CONTAM: hypothetical protein GTU68_007584 [Idotea baltica]|nr:hypothetical protein [Idotea baltica]